MRNFYNEKGNASIDITIGGSKSLMRQLSRVNVTEMSPVHCVEAMTTRQQRWLDGTPAHEAVRSLNTELTALVDAAEDLYCLQGQDVGVFTSGVFQMLETDFAGDGLIDLIYTLSSEYRNNASFILAPETHLTIRKLKDSNGRPLMLAGDSKAEPNRLLGFPCYESEGAAASRVAFGDWRKAYEMTGPLFTKVTRNRENQAPLIEYTGRRPLEAGPIDSKAAVLLQI